MKLRCRLLGHQWGAAYYSPFFDASHQVRCSRCGATRPARNREIMQAFEERDERMPRHWRVQYGARQGRPRT